MATLQWASPVSDSLWDSVKHAAGMVCQRSGAYLTGQYQYIFHNQTSWTVKLHLVDDDPTQKGKANSQCGGQGYFLTLPVGSHNVEIPMKSSLVTITGGFFHATKGCYEIFWDRRRFAWKPSLSIAVQQRHSTNANVFRSDVTPGAELVVQLEQAHEAFAIFTPSCTLTTQQSLEIAYSCVGGKWRPAAVMDVLPGGLLQLEDGTVQHPLEQPTLVPSGPAQSLEPEVWEAAVMAGGQQLVMPMQQESLAPAEGAAGQSLHAHCNSQDAWDKAEVTKGLPAIDRLDFASAFGNMTANIEPVALPADEKVFADRSATLQYGACKSSTIVHPEDQSKILKTM